MSTLTMKSSWASACPMRAPLGADSTGLLATDTSARMRPDPAVSISSARQLVGYSPSTSGAPDTRLRERPVTMPRPTPGLPCVLAANAAALGNIAPPSASRWPVRMLSASTSTELSVPKRCVLEPMRE